MLFLFKGCIELFSTIKYCIFVESQIITATEMIAIQTNTIFYFNIVFIYTTACFPILIEII